MIIYHYTTISGLLGIVSNSELWASDCRFLNDGSELSYANDIFWDEVKKLNLRPIGDCEGGGYRLPFSVLRLFRMYITCFCTNGDQLSQWRGYGEDQGYSLGFSSAKLIKQGLGTIVPVQYGISNPSEYFKEELKDAPTPTAHPGVYDYHASEWFLPRIARVKHPGFAEEKEWRLLKQLPEYEVNGPESDIRFRSSSMGPIPYLTLPFKKHCLREIVIGPGGKAESRESAVRNLLDHYNFEKVRIRLSKIPYRE
jgi:hypothetical protein